MTKNFKLRKSIPLEHFISIRFKVIYPQKITGHLIYLREDYPGYSVLAGDKIDQFILDGIRKISLQAEFNYRTTLLTEQQLEQALKITRGGVSKDFIFHFIPELNNENAARLSRDKNLAATSIALTRTFWSEDKNAIKTGMVSELIQTIPESELEKIKTIKKI